MKNFNVEHEQFALPIRKRFRYNFHRQERTGRVSTKELRSGYQKSGESTKMSLLPAESFHRGVGGRNLSKLPGGVDAQRRNRVKYIGLK